MSRLSKGLRWLGIGALTGMANFQIASCTVDEGGVISAFADTVALAELRSQLWELSPFSGFLGHHHGHFDDAEDTE